MPVAIAADLRLEVDGVRARVHTTGGDLVVDTEEPWDVVRSVRRAARAVGADLVLPGAVTTTRVVLRGPRGDVVRVPVRDGRFVRRRDLRVRRPQDLLSPTRRRTLVAAALGLGGATLLLRRLRLADHPTRRPRK